MGSIRSIERNILRNRYGNKGLATAWKRFQINRYGYDRHREIVR
jgi:hypothetical protein